MGSDPGWGWLSLKNILVEGKKNWLPPVSQKGDGGVGGGRGGPKSMLAKGKENGSDPGWEGCPKIFVAMGKKNDRPRGGRQGGSKMFSPEAKKWCKPRGGLSQKVFSP